VESAEAVYRRLLVENEARVERERKRHIWLGYAKVADFLAGVIAAFGLLRSGGLLWLLLIPVALFVVLVVVHDRVIRRLGKFVRVTEFYSRGMARLENQWMGTGETGDRFFDAAHPYARDLDLFGKGSLFELLCTARTRAGEETLARWLLAAADPEEVRARQAAVSEMKERVRLRERLFTAGDKVRVGVHPEALAAWGDASGDGEAWRTPGWLPWLLGALAGMWLAAIVYWMSGHSFDLLLLMSLANYAVSYAMQRRVRASVEGMEKAAVDLKVLAEVLEVMEQETFVSERLSGLRASLDTGHVAPSAAVKKLERIYDWLEDRRNGFVAIFNPFVFYAAQLTMAAERWRAQFGPAIRGWLGAVGEFEALAALAGYAWEHPADVLPEFTHPIAPTLGAPTPGTPGTPATEERGYFEAEDLAHPLLPAAKAVGNDLMLGRAAQLIVISGPNMAGKSTFLRGVGLNAVLAQCGAPVRARRMKLSPLAVGASICVLDSLAGGVSRFYAEIQRLKVLSDLASGPAPLLFLLDELLSGTNSHDRLEGTRFVVRELVRQGAIGLVTTHDLALTAIPEAMDGAGQNCHFEDSIEDGQLRFDYRLKAGVVRTSNALKLMKAVGLDVGGNGE
jgi:hypothetical protein